DRPRQTKAALLAGERARLHQGPNALLDEKGIAAPDQQSLEGLQRRIVAKEGAQQLTCILWRERIEPQPAVVCLPSPAVVVLGPVVDQQEHPRRRQALDETIEYGLRCGIDPVQVLEYQEDRLAQALAEQQLFHGLQGQPTACGRVQYAPLGVFDRHVEEGQQSWQRR